MNLWANYEGMESMGKLVSDDYKVLKFMGKHCYTNLLADYEVMRSMGRHYFKNLRTGLQSEECQGYA